MEPKSPAAVTCKSCARTWNSAAMAEGLHLLGACPRCGGALEFGAVPSEPIAAPVAEQEPRVARVSPAPLAPHLVLGIPRR